MAHCPRSSSVLESPLSNLSDSTQHAVEAQMEQEAAQSEIGGERDPQACVPVDGHERVEKQEEHDEGDDDCIAHDPRARCGEVDAVVGVGPHGNEWKQYR